MMIPDHMPRIRVVSDDLVLFPSSFRFTFRELTILLEYVPVSKWVARLQRPEPLRYHGLAAAVGDAYGTTPQSALDTLVDRLTDRVPQLFEKAVRLCAGAYVSHGDVVVERQRVERLIVQLAGCLTAAEGATRDPAPPNSYGWSPAYQRVLELRKAYDELHDEVVAEPCEQSNPFGTCPDCNGEGTAIVADLLPNGHHERTVPCPTCEGSGVEP